MKYTNEQLKELLKGVYDGSIDPHNLPYNLYVAISDYLKSGLYKGYGGSLVDFKGKDLALLTELRENVYMFSAAKTYQEVSALNELLINENNELRTMKEFTQLGAELHEKWNDAWGKTEYHTAVEQGRMASMWNEIERNKKLLPLLTYQALGEGNSCEICLPLDGLTAPVNDSIWDSIYPTNHFNCACSVTQHTEDEADITPKQEREDIVNSVTEKMSDVFKMNAGKDGYVFSPEHPYFQVAPKDRSFAKENFNLPIPEED